MRRSYPTDQRRATATMAATEERVRGDPRFPPTQPGGPPGLPTDQALWAGASGVADATGADTPPLTLSVSARPPGNDPRAGLSLPCRPIRRPPSTRTRTNQRSTDRGLTA